MIDPGTLTSIVIEIIKFIFKPVTLLFKWILDKLPFEFRWKRPELAIIQAKWGNHEWTRAKHGDEPVIVIHSKWTVTNVLSYNITALNAYLTRPEKSKGSVLIKHHESDIYGSYVIPQGYTTEVHVDFVINQKRIKKDDQKIKLSFYFEDSIGRRYKKSFTAEPPKKTVEKKEKLKIEDSSKIDNPTEKKLVAVLKNEVQQYKARGRREGRLGTVEWPRGTIEWRDADKKINYLFENSSSQNVSSEHVDAIKKLFADSNKKNKGLIIDGLLSRFNKKSEYRDVAYLIIFSLFEIGSLDKVSLKTLKKVSGDDAHGFSDALRLIDLLLAFRFDEFNEKMLDDIEELVYSTKEHSFSIKQRINAIRVRLITDGKETRNKN